MTMLDTWRNVRGLDEFSFPLPNHKKDCKRCYGRGYEGIFPGGRYKVCPKCAKGDIENAHCSICELTGDLTISDIDTMAFGVDPKND